MEGEGERGWGREGEGREGGLCSSNISLKNPWHASPECCTQTPLISVTNLPRLCGTLFTTLDRCTIDNMQWSKILVKNSNFFIPHLHSMPQLRGPRWNIAIRFGMEKLEWCGYPTVKTFKGMTTCCDRIHERDRQTDGQIDRGTPHDCTGIV